MGMDRLSGEQISRLLPPHNPALALLVNGRWEKKGSTDRYELQANVNRLGEPIPFTFGWIKADLWEDEAEQDRVARLRRKMVGEAIERHSRPSWTISTEQAQNHIQSHERIE